MKNKGFNPAKRSKARGLALQALYQWQISKCTIAEILEQYLESEQSNRADVEYFEDLVKNVIQQCESLDAKFIDYVSRPLQELDPVELNILRLSTYELIAHPEIPYRVIINEAVELAKIFGATDGHKFVNGVLDKMAPVIRSVEAKK